MRDYTVLHLFSGIGGAALGFQEAKSEYRGMVGSFRTLAGIDCDPEACRDFEAITGAPAVQMDLFSRYDYIAFMARSHKGIGMRLHHGTYLRRLMGIPDVVFLSPPCKGFSGLLPSNKAKSDKYQALNRLVVRGLQLVLDAYEEDLPAVVMLENVPRITSRGEFLLRQVKHLLGKYGYVFHEGTHDCGELGNLGQRRKRYLLIARNEEKMPSFIYRPAIQSLKTIGDVIGPLPLPDDPACGPMHRLPRLQWKTWVRLALIPAGGDWRDLENCGEYGLEYIPRNGGWQVAPWDETAGTVVGAARVGHSNGVAAIADPRLSERDNRHPGVYQVVKMDEPAPCVTGSRFGSGAPAIADPRTGFKNSTHLAIYRVTSWEEPGPTVTGANRQNNGAITIADPRLGCSPRNGTMGVQSWDEPAKTVIGAGDIHAGATAVADPRIPKDTEVLEPPPIIIALDGTWHRPLTTFELAMLQGFPPMLADGSPLQLSGKSDARWRERIGNTVPPPTARAIGEEILLALMSAKDNLWMLSSTGIWVHSESVVENAEVLQ